MSLKDDYLAQLNLVFDDPALMTALETRKISQLPDIQAGATNEAANLAVSQFCANQNQFLQLFLDIPILKYLLMGCALSPVFQSINLSGLEAVRSPTPHDIIPYCPAAGQTFAVEAGISFAADVLGIEDCTGVFARISGPASTTITLTPIGGARYACPDPIGFQTAGAYTAVFEGWFRPNYRTEKTVPFEVV